MLTHYGEGVVGVVCQFWDENKVLLGKRKAACFGFFIWDNYPKNAAFLEVIYFDHYSDRGGTGLQLFVDTLLKMGADQVLVNNDVLQGKEIHLWFDVRKTSSHMLVLISTLFRFIQEWPEVVENFVFLKSKHPEVSDDSLMWLAQIIKHPQNENPWERQLGHHCIPGTADFSKTLKEIIEESKDRLSWRDEQNYTPHGDWIMKHWGASTHGSNHHLEVPYTDNLIKEKLCA